MSTKRQYWMLVISAALILAVTMGLRNALGLFVSPLNTSTGLGIVTISFALAVGPVRLGRGAADVRCARGSRRLVPDHRRRRSAACRWAWR